MPVLEFTESTKQGTTELPRVPAGGNRGAIGIGGYVDDGVTRPRVEPEEDRPPRCPTCSRRLVILATQPWRDERGVPVRRQLWGCPYGHATAYRVHGAFGPIDVYSESDEFEH